MRKINLMSAIEGLTQAIMIGFNVPYVEAGTLIHDSLMDLRNNILEIIAEKYNLTHNDDISTRS